MAGLFNPNPLAPPSSSTTTLPSQPAPAPTAEPYVPQFFNDTITAFGYTWTVNPIYCLTVSSLISLLALLDSAPAAKPWNSISVYMDQPLGAAAGSPFYATQGAPWLQFSASGQRYKVQAGVIAAQFLPGKWPDQKVAMTQAISLIAQGLASGLQA